MVLTGGISQALPLHRSIWGADGKIVGHVQGRLGVLRSQSETGQSVLGTLFLALCNCCL